MTYTLSGSYVHGDGSARVGRLKFEPSVAITDGATIILPAPLEVVLDAAGSFSVALVGTDDADYSPSGWVWTVTELLSGGRAAWSFELTADSDIGDLSPVAVPDAYTIYVQVGDELTASLSSGDAALGYVPTADGAGAISWAAQSGSGGGVGLSDATPADLGTAAPGTGLSASREDHVHGMPTAADVGAAATSHGHTLADVTDAGTAAALDVPATGDAASGQVVKGDDTRLTDARTPSSTLAHAASHGAGQSDAVTVALSQVSDAGGAAALDVGTTTGTVAAGDDSRLSDARTPTAHAASHASAGGDPVTLAQSQVTDLTTDLAAKVSKSLYDAQTILAATADDTPAALTVAEQRVVGRITGGNIAALTAAQLITMQAGQSAVNTVGTSGATETLPATHEFHDVTMSENCTFTFTSPTGAHVFALVLRGAFTPTWPASVDWSGGTAPSYADPSLFAFATVDAGTTWLGGLVGSAYA